MQYSGKRPAQKSLLCEFRQKTAYKHIISSLRKVRHKELGPCLALLYLLLYVINNTHSIQEELNHTDVKVNSIFCYGNSQPRT